MTFTVRKGRDGKWRFRVVGGNNRNIASGEANGYNRREGALHAVRLIKEQAANARVVFE